MTRKDYLLIADSLRKALSLEVSIHGAQSGTAGGVRLAAYAIARDLYYDNKRFDRDHFLAIVTGEKDINSASESTFKRRLRVIGNQDARDGKSIESFYAIPGIKHSENERAEYEIGYRSFKK